MRFVETFYDIRDASRLILQKGTISSFEEREWFSELEEFLETKKYFMKGEGSDKCVLG